MADYATPNKRDGPERPDQPQRWAAQLQLTLQNSRNEAAALRQQLSEAEEKVRKTQRELERSQQRLRRSGEEKEQLAEQLELERSVWKVQGYALAAQVHELDEQLQAQQYLPPPAPLFCAMCAGGLGQQGAAGDRCGGWCAEWEEWRGQCRRLARRLERVEGQLQQQMAEHEEQLEYMRLVPRKCGWCREREE